MQVAHRVNCEDVCKHWNQKQVTDESNRISFEILEEVDRSQKEWHEVDEQHDHSSQHKPRKVVVALGYPDVAFLR